MKKPQLIILFFCFYINAFGQTPGGFKLTGTMFRNSNTVGYRYVLLDVSKLPIDVVVHKVTLKRSLSTYPKPTDLTIEVYNILFNQKDLAVFSVMPSLFSKNPTWKKINIDTISNSMISITQLHTLMQSKFVTYPLKEKGRLDRLKYYNYILIFKKDDGYYCNTTDCFTEFLTIDDNEKEVVMPTGFKLNLKAKMLSIAEYESDYRRRHGEYSSNFFNDKNSYFNDDVKDGPRLNLSYVIEYQNKKSYKFWLLDQFYRNNINAERGMDRFIFQPGVGIIGAAYEFFMRDLANYWYHLPQAPNKIIKGSVEDKKYYNLTPYFSEYDPILLDYLNEDVIKYLSIEKL
ncbi:hypothetical protein GWR56_02635 [Mucilaginibacter sp. 14171R-50]|uniref:hypothetical protein n=1 Tax=Mucilaginibacter sp. 14171R-50 TaxID=2703789 RepID=UPI00138C2192|nr:hypothetical protein [Mucilaginibacter sp. 14171R-50]QHS54492.1 hypothetical protein GWR56_02635 [Mucilaginibacter sp. 14171R-50]